MEIMIPVDARGDSTLQGSSFQEESSTSGRILADEASHEPMSKTQAWSLYTSHFLSTWNMRIYEFAAVSSFFPTFASMIQN